MVGDWDCLGRCQSDKSYWWRGTWPEFVLLSTVHVGLFAFFCAIRWELPRMVLTTIRVRTGFDCIFVRVAHGVWWSMARSRMTLLPPLQLWLKLLGVRQQTMLICPDCLCSGLFCHKWPIVFLVNRQVQRFIADSISWLQAKDGEKDGELTWWAVPTTCYFFPGRTLRLRLPWKRQFLLRERRLNLFCCVTHGVWWSIVRSRMTLLAPLPLQLWLKFLGVRQQMMLICPDCLCSGLFFLSQVIYSFLSIVKCRDLSPIAFPGVQAKDGEKDGELTWWAVPTACYFFPGRTLWLRLPWKRQFLLRERPRICYVVHYSSCRLFAFSAPLVSSARKSVT